MKCEILKRTAIALFVGGIVSASATAEDKSVEAAGSDFGKAIKAEVTKQTEAVKSELTKKIEEQDKKINDDLSGVASDLVGVAANSYNNTLTLNGFKAGDDVYDVDTTTGAVSKKTATEEDVEADPLKGKGVINSINDIISDVDDLEKEVIKTVETVNDHTKVLDGDGTDANPGLVSKVNNLEDDVYGDGTDANPGLVGVIDKHSEIINDLKRYNNLDDVKKLVENKADKTDVDANKVEIAKKANASDVYTKTESDSKLDAKADKQALEDLKKEVKDNEEGIGALSDFVNNVDSDVDELAKQHNELSDKHNTLVDKHNELVKEVKEFADETNNKLNDKADKQALEDLKKEVKDNEEGIGALSDFVNNVDSDVDELAKQHNELSDKHNTLVDKHNELVKEVKEFADETNNKLNDKADKQALKDLSEGIRDNVLPAIEANRSDIDKNASHITDIRNKQALQNARLDTHGERIDANKAEIAKKANQTDVDANKAEIAKKANQTDVDANKAEIAKKANQTDVDANKAEIAKKADKTELATKADKNSVYSKSETDEKFALKADNSVVRAQATDISNLRTDVNAHKVDIDKLRTDVNVHTKRLDHLDNRVNKLDKDLKRGLAAQAALTGLFQPYTVGKANFTAAVGGYKSQTAIAIGTGYRYNQNIATKAGVAFTQGGGVTYNAGVNFEW
ncbi:YadA-like family protein [Haemophilus haemolyticus]|uniref:YadA-like family protein n=1 Tax=Haemophilus haemolyticus TaxID=726 RepID=UPI000E5735F9|nr:YadA-like family protein [Haemophilus haemolyticus]